MENANLLHIAELKDIIKTYKKNNKGNKALKDIKITGMTKPDLLNVLKFNKIPIPQEYLHIVNKPSKKVKKVENKSTDLLGIAEKEVKKDDKLIDFIDSSIVDKEIRNDLQGINLLNEKNENLIGELKDQINDQGLNKNNISNIVNKIEEVVVNNKELDELVDGMTSDAYKKLKDTKSERMIKSQIVKIINNHEKISKTFGNFKKEIANNLDEILETSEEEGKKHKKISFGENKVHEYEISNEEKLDKFKGHLEADRSNKLDECIDCLDGCLEDIKGSKKIIKGLCEKNIKEREKRKIKEFKEDNYKMKKY